jgi:hypothetical protein
MTDLQWKIAVTGTVLAFFAVVGIVARGRYRIWWFFSLYLVAVLVLGGLPQVWPIKFHTPEFWELRQTVYAGLRFAMAAEVGVRTMRAFPGAMATARRLVFLILLVTLVAVVTAPKDSRYTSYVGELIPRVLNGSIWMLMAIAAVILWYRLPVHPFHKAILLSYIPYTVVFTMVTQYFSDRGVPQGGLVQYVGQIAYVALLAYWNYAIWRKDPPADRGREQHPLAGAA